MLFLLHRCTYLKQTLTLFLLQYVIFVLVFNNQRGYTAFGFCLSKVLDVSVALLWGPLQ